MNPSMHCSPVSRPALRLFIFTGTSSFKGSQFHRQVQKPYDDMSHTLEQVSMILFDD